VTTEARSGSDRGDRHLRADDRRSLPRRLARLGLLVVVLLVVFGWFLPEVVGVDYASVWNTIRRLTFEEATGLAALTILWMLLEAVVSKSVLRGLPVWTALLAWLGPNAVIASGAPPGTDMAIRYAMFRSRFTLEESASASVATGIVYILIKVALVIPAGLLVFAVGRGDSGIVGLMLTAGFIAVAGAVLIVLLVRSTRFAGLVGALLERAASWVTSKLKRGEAAHVRETVLDVRGQLATSLGRRWPIVAASIVAAQIGMWLVLVGSIRVTGTDASELELVFIFAAFAYTQLVTSVPIVPGNMGVSEAALTGVMVAFAGKEFGTDIAAGVALYRTLTWLLPIPLGYAALGAFRRSERRPHHPSAT
jgi:uncharacterized membrane protein YbhN (UPF0104 family)